MKYINLIAILIFSISLIFVFFTSLDDKQKKSGYLDTEIWETQKKICIEQGGIPVQSNWDGQIKECKK